LIHGHVHRCGARLIWFALCQTANYLLRCVTHCHVACTGSNAAQQTNSHLMSILSESIRTTVDLESRISQCIAELDLPTPRSGGQRLAAGAARSPRDAAKSRLSAGLLCDIVSQTLCQFTLSQCLAHHVT